jgi:hypothetical protein
LSTISGDSPVDNARALVIFTLPKSLDITMLNPYAATERRILKL